MRPSGWGQTRGDYTRRYTKLPFWAVIVGNPTLEMKGHISGGWERRI